MTIIAATLILICLLLVRFGLPLACMLLARWLAGWWYSQSDD